MAVQILDSRMLQAKKITCKRDHRVLFQDLSFSLDRGSALQVCGINGAGKSTLLRILAGLYEEFDGEVEWDLEDYPLFSGHRAGVKELMTARENLLWAADLYGQNISQKKVDEALSQVSLDGFETVACGAMSEGQRRRVGLARLYLLDNPVWILDEPFAAIDTDGVQRITQRINEHLAGDGVVVFASHLEVSIENMQKIELAR